MHNSHRCTPYMNWSVSIIREEAGYLGISPWFALQYFYPSYMYFSMIHPSHACVMTGSPGDGKALRGQQTWAGPSVTGSAGWSQKWYGGIIVDILAKESKFP